LPVKGFRGFYDEFGKIEENRKNTANGWQRDKLTDKRLANAAATVL
jgi:hypothetical protein